MVNECIPVNESKPKNSQEKPRRNFLKENIQNLKTFKKKCNTIAANKDNHDNRTVSSIKSKNFQQVETKCDSKANKWIKDKNRNKDFEDPNELKELFVRKPAISNQSVQTWDNKDESYWDNVKFLKWTPSSQVLKKLSKQMETKILDNHSLKVQEHLSELKEYLEKGSISRRKGQSITSGSSKYISSERSKLPWRQTWGENDLKQKLNSAINSFPGKRSENESLNASHPK